MGYTTEQANAFISMIAPIMINEAKSRGYKVVSTAIAQAVVEGACNTSVLAYKYHNHFGLKCGKPWLEAGKPSVSLKTKEEYTPGNLTTIKDYFRVYSDDIEGVKGYYEFISTKRYANLKTAKNYIEYANYLKLDGYATSSPYINTLCSTVRKYSLDRFDVYGTATKPEFEVGKTYTLDSDLYIRKTPNGEKLKLDDLSANAKQHAFVDGEGNAILKKGTRVTCKGLTELSNSTWLQIPSGYVCCKNTTKAFVK